MTIDFEKLYKAARAKLSNYLKEIGQNSSLPDPIVGQVSKHVIKSLRKHIKKNGDKDGFFGVMLDNLINHHNSMYFIPNDDSGLILYETEGNIKKRSLWYEKITPEDWENVIIAGFAHELIHAYLRFNCAMPHTERSVLVNEYLACAIDFEFLSPNNQAAMRRSAETLVIPDDWFNINVFSGNNGGIYFGWPAYLHYTKNQVNIFADILKRKENWRPYYY